MDWMFVSDVDEFVYILPTAKDSTLKEEAPLQKLINSIEKEAQRNNTNLASIQFAAFIFGGRVDPCRNCEKSIPLVIDTFRYRRDDDNGTYQGGKGIAYVRFTFPFQLSVPTLHLIGFLLVTKCENIRYSRRWFTRSKS